MKANEIGSVIKSRLLQSDKVVMLVKKEIHPIVAPSGTAYPFITYCRTSVSPSYTKDRRSVEDTATANVIVHAATYKQSIELLNAVFDALQGYCGTIDGIHIDDIRMINSEEDFQEDCYLQSLTFEIDVIND